MRIKHPFWDIQPVQHTYRLFDQTKGIIRKTHPIVNSYCDFTHIMSLDVHDSSAEAVFKRMAELIQSQYLQNGENKFYPDFEHMMPYFVGHLSPCYMSVYKCPNHLDTDRIIGSITSRPLSISLNKTQFNAYYVDYLCVHVGHRGKGIAPRLIQTHEYFQTHSNPNMCISIFKREDELTSSVVPLCSFTIHCYDMRAWAQLPHNNTLGITMPENEQAIISIYDMISAFETSLRCLTSKTNFIMLVQSGNLLVVESNAGLFVFRKSCTFIEEGCEMLVLIASICLTESMFMKSFQYAVQHILSQTKGASYTHLGIERLGANGQLINGLKSKPVAVNSMAYYFYNYACPTVCGDDVLFIC